MRGSIGRDDSAGDTQPQLRPPTDLRGIPAALVSLTSHGAAGMGQPSKFVMLNGWTEVKSYRDDGYSGGNFQRPGFLEMLEDARHGLINLILVKDLSRLGRDFVEKGRKP